MPNLDLALIGNCTVGALVDAADPRVAAAHRHRRLHATHFLSQHARLREQCVSSKVGAGDTATQRSTSRHDPRGPRRVPQRARCPAAAATSSRIGRIGLTSMLPTRAGGIFAATWMASLRSRASIR